MTAVLCAVLLAFLTYFVAVLLTGASPVVGDVSAVVIPTVVTILLLRFRPLAYIGYFLFLVLGQSFFTGVSLRFVDAEPSFFVTEIKTTAIVIAFFYLIVPIYRYLLNAPSLLCAVILYVASIGVSVRALDPGALAYGRNFIAPAIMLIVIIVLTGRMSADNRLRLFENFLAVTVGFLVVGNIAELLMGSHEWRTLLSADDQKSLGSLSTETFFFGFTLPRAGGVMVEPVTSGYIAGAALVGVILVAVRRYRAQRRWWLTPLCLGLGAAFVLVTAATKASLLMFAVAIGAYVLTLLLRGRHAWAVVLGTWVGSMLAILAYMALTKGIKPVLGLWSDPLSLIGGDSTPIHLAGLVFGLKSALENLVGAGLGNGGNFSRYFSGAEERPPYAEWLASGSESAVGVLAYQLGLLGLIAFLLLIFALGRVLGSNSTVLLAVWSSTALMAESMFGPLVAALFMLGAGLLREDQESSWMDKLLVRTFSAKRTNHDGT